MVSHRFPRSVSRASDPASPCASGCASLTDLPCHKKHRAGAASRHTSGLCSFWGIERPMSQWPDSGGTSFEGADQLATMPRLFSIGSWSAHAWAALSYCSRPSPSSNLASAGFDAIHHLRVTRGESGQAVWVGCLIVASPGTLNGRYRGNGWRQIDRIR